ncbi:MAG: hypothetical protein ABI841_07500 [Chloroflexota bacterium]
MAGQTTHIDVRCDRSSGRWLCRVAVGNDPAATTHEVDVTDADLSRLAPNADVQRLVEASFRFLLEREPREAILRRFTLPVIGRYFPEYVAEIGRRL